MEKDCAETIRMAARKRYGGIAQRESVEESGCQRGSCCGQAPVTLKGPGQALGYSREEIESVPDGVNMGLGCGNPKAIASLKHGETVLDLGCGGGFDCFLAAKEVGVNGAVIGVDMTPEMLSKARDNARKAGTENVEFRLGEIEHLPVEDGTIDVVISNCVVNLSPEKRKVFREAYRVLKPGGRLAISDVVAGAPLPEEMKKDLTLVTACIGGAETAETIKLMLEEAGFEQIDIDEMEESRRFIRDWLPGRGIEDYIVSATVRATKPVDTGSKIGPGGPGKERPGKTATRKKAYEFFKTGYLCAEVISKTVLETFSHEPCRAEAIRSASGFCGGVGGTTEELCGAFTGGVLALGFLFGREKPGDSLTECGNFIKEFRKRFLAEFGSLNCSTLLKGFEDRENPPLECVQLTAHSSEILVDLLMKAEKERMIDLGLFLSLPRDKAQLGRCPFSACDQPGETMPGG